MANPTATTNPSRSEPRTLGESVIARWQVEASARKASQPEPIESGADDGCQVRPIETAGDVDASEPMALGTARAAVVEPIGAGPTDGPESPGDVARAGQTASDATPRAPRPIGLVDVRGSATAVAKREPIRPHVEWIGKAVRHLVADGSMVVRADGAVSFPDDADGSLAGTWATWLRVGSESTGLDPADLQVQAIAEATRPAPDAPQADPSAPLGTDPTEAPSDPARRLRRVWLTESEVDTLTRTDDGPKRSALLVALGLPTDVVVIRRAVDAEREAVAVTLRSASFGPVSVGAVVPMLERFDDASRSYAADVADRSDYRAEPAPDDGGWDVTFQEAGRPRRSLWTTFIGPTAEANAREYADRKNAGESSPIALRSVPESSTVGNWRVLDRFARVIRCGLSEAEARRIVAAKPLDRLTAGPAPDPAVALAVDA